MRMKVTSPDLVEDRRHPMENGFIQATTNTPVRAFMLRPDMAICFWECTTRNATKYQMSFDEPMLRFSFILDGEGFSSVDQQEDLPRHRGLAEIRYCPAGRGNISLGSDQTHKWVDIMVTPSFLALALPGETDTLPHFVQQLIAGETDGITPVTKPMTPELFVAASQLAHCPYTNAARTLYLKSRTLELLSHVLAVYSPVPCRTQLSSYETECLKRAKELLISDLDKPTSIPVLAQRVGLSESKLKAGFKTLFGQTVYGYFKAYRIDLGRQRLLESNESVSEIATSVGYTNMSHFSAAFKERHGVTPSKYRKDNVFFTQKGAA